MPRFNIIASNEPITMTAANLNSPYIHEGTQAHFSDLVLKNSHQGPVLVNFWNPKAGPCLRQYPLLDKVVHELEGRFLLVNVDTEQEKKIAADYGVTSVPTLKLFRNETVQQTLHGYQDENSLKALLAKFVARDSDQQIANALVFYRDGNTSQAFNVLAQAVIDDPDNLKVPEVISKLLLKEQRFDEAYRLLSNLPEEARKEEEIAALIAQLSFIRIQQKSPSRAELEARIAQNPDDHRGRYQLAIQQILQHEFEAGLQELLKLMTEVPHFGEQAARKALLATFRLLKNQGPLVEHYRRLMQDALN
ncbi:MAG: tetratricopeptide repeat protein [Gammaproteobacteria bacterium]|nr:tetratricopeptide repeat protein [Gammaproteobacteria bacterium]